MASGPVREGIQPAASEALDVEVVLDIHRQIVASRFDPAVIDEAVPLLESWVFSSRRSRSDDLGFAAAARRDLHRAYALWETRLELAFADQVSTGRASIVEYPLADRFDRLIEREITLAGPLGPRSSVLFIGSGPVPISAVYIHARTGATVRCLDSDRASVTVSRRLLQNLGLHHAIRVDHGAGQYSSAGAPSLVVVALLAKPKAAILDHMWHELPPECSLILRTSCGPCRVLYEPSVNVVDGSRWQTVGQSLVDGSMGDTISSLHLRRGTRRGSVVRHRTVAP